MRAGIAGAGAAGKFHFECWKRIHSIPIKVVGVTDISLEAIEEFAQKRGIKAIASLADLLDEVDIVDICVPPYAQEEMIVRAAEAGKDVIVEKPFTGYFGPNEGRDEFRAYGVLRSKMLSEAIASMKRIEEGSGHLSGLSSFGLSARRDTAGGRRMAVTIGGSGL